MHSLLDVRMIRMRENNGKITKYTLPEVLHELTTKERAHFSFPGLQPFQKGPWHAFLAQLGALVYHHFRAPSSVEDWREGLLYLTKGDEDPWHLVIEDFSKPAFMQPPNPTPTGVTSSSPDFYSMLTLAKEHVVKTRIKDNFELDLWVFGLIGGQTNRTTFAGRTHYSISRSKSARHYLSKRFEDNGLVQDIHAILASRPRLIESGFSENGCALMWLSPCITEKGKSYLMSDLDPFYVEVCDNARLCEGEGVYALEVKGLPDKMVSFEDPLGDFWEIQVDGKQKGEVVNLDSFRVLGWSVTAQLGVCAEEGTYVDYGCLVQGTSGQPKSQGYHQFQLPVLGSSVSLSEEWAEWESWLKSSRKVLWSSLNPLCDYLNTSTYLDAFNVEARKLFQEMFTHRQGEWMEWTVVFRTRLGELVVRVFKDAASSVSAPAHKKYPLTNKATAFLMSGLMKEGLRSE